MEINEKKVKGIIFDLDGTLLDSCSIWKDIDYKFFKKRNLKLPSDYAEAIGHLGLDKAAEYTINRFNLKESKEEIIKEWKDGVFEEYSNNVGLKPHVYEFLKYLKESKIPFCAATANDEDCYKGALINNGIYDLFDFILEVGSFSSGKEKPDIYLEAAKLLNVEPKNCAVFEDLLMALLTAKNAGFISVAVKEDTCKEEELKKQLADFYLTDFISLIGK